LNWILAQPSRNGVAGRLATLHGLEPPSHLTVKKNGMPARRVAATFTCWLRIGQHALETQGGQAHTGSDRTQDRAFQELAPCGCFHGSPPCSWAATEYIR